MNFLFQVVYPDGFALEDMADEIRDYFNKRTPVDLRPFVLQVVDVVQVVEDGTGGVVLWCQPPM